VVGPVQSPVDFKSFVEVLDCGGLLGGSEETLGNASEAENVGLVSGLLLEGGFVAGEEFDGFGEVFLGLLIVFAFELDLSEGLGDEGHLVVVVFVDGLVYFKGFLEAVVGLAEDCFLVSLLLMGSLLHVIVALLFEDAGHHCFSLISECFLLAADLKTLLQDLVCCRKCPELRLKSSLLDSEVAPLEGVLALGSTLVYYLLGDSIGSGGC
jgi:hypothetical protein